MPIEDKELPHYTHIDDFQNDLGDQFTAMYDPAMNCGWLTGGELDDDWICIFDGYVEGEFYFNEPESLWLEHWWYEATKTRLTTFQSLMSLMSILGPEAIAKIIPSLQKTIPESVINTRPAPGGRPRITGLSAEEKPVMKAYRVGTKPAEIATKLGKERKEVQDIITRVKLREKRHKKSD